MAFSCVIGEYWPLWLGCCVASGEALPLSGLALTQSEILVDSHALRWPIAPRLPVRQRLQTIRPCSGNLCPQALGETSGVNSGGRARRQEHLIKAWQGPAPAFRPQARLIYVPALKVTMLVLFQQREAGRSGTGKRLFNEAGKY